jgi:hypothetical protein
MSIPADRRTAKDDERRIMMRKFVRVLLPIALISLGLLYRESASESVKHQDWRDIFSLTVHAADGTPQRVQPESSFPFGTYHMTDSRAPGFPMVITAEGADEIRLETTGGSLVSWNPPDYYVYPLGMETVLAPGETVYWTPLAEEQPAAAVAESDLRMSASRGNKMISQALIHIQSDAAGSYTGKWVKGD